MRRPQFSLKTLLWLMAVVAAFVAELTVRKRIERRQWESALRGEPDPGFIYYPDLRMLNTENAEVDTEGH